MRFTVELKNGTKPMARKPYQMSIPELQKLKVQLKELLDLGLIRPNVSPWGALVNFLRKKDGLWRLCLTTVEYSLTTFDIFSYDGRPG
jgi:hypothetical protein